MSLLSELWWTGVRAVGGYTSVQRALKENPEILGPHHGSKSQLVTEVLAVGKAAGSMARGALESLPTDTPGLVVTKRGHIGSLLDDYPQLEVIESGHPIPDVQSLLAGQRLYERVRALPAESHLILLVSGGASALAERLPPGVSLTDWQRKTENLVASGSDIHAINAERSKLSLIKSGRLLKAFNGASASILAISDVEGDSHRVIGSGLGDPSYLNCKTHSQTVAANSTARAAIVEAARSQGLVVQENSESLYGDVYDVAQRMGETLLTGEPGLYLWGGESTIALPENPGKGGRNQALALAVARVLGARGQALEVLVAGTDGTDGPTAAAGGWLRDTTAYDLAELDSTLALADAGTLLGSHNELFVTGPTHTNVMDLALCLKR